MHGLLRVIFKQTGPWVEPRQLIGAEVEGGREGEEKEVRKKGMEERSGRWEVGGGRAWRGTCAERGTNEARRMSGEEMSKKY